MQEFACCRFSQHNGEVPTEIALRKGFHIQPQLALAFTLVRAVARTAVFRQDRPDVAAKLDGPLGGMARGSLQSLRRSGNTASDPLPLGLILSQLIRAACAIDRPDYPRANTVAVAASIQFSSTKAHPLRLSHAILEPMRVC